MNPWLLNFRNGFMKILAPTSNFWAFDIPDCLGIAFLEPDCEANICSEPLMQTSLYKHTARYLGSALLVVVRATATLRLLGGKATTYKRGSHEMDAVGDATGVSSSFPSQWVALRYYVWANFICFARLRNLCIIKSAPWCKKFYYSL